ncbi:MAG TPA: O-antigen ligase family protein [Fimbriimonadaceae bacterium]|nr:O-antigen ligase family protein [Fimbriimonadaceae bacterium]
MASVRMGRRGPRDHLAGFDLHPQEQDRQSQAEVEEIVKRVPVSVVLLSLAAFLIPLIGGQIPNDVATLEPGYTPTVQSLFRGGEIATLQHALLGLLVVAAFVYLVVKRKIVQVPQASISGPLVGFLILVLASVLLSSYRWVSLTSFAEWAIYGLILIVSVAGLGRKSGPMIVLGSLSAGTGLVALLGIFEYGGERLHGNPSWRIFANWNNPNALAGVLVLGLLVSLGLLAVLSARRGALLAGTSAVLSGIAILLTGSKGGLLALLVGLAVFGLLAIVWKKPAALLRALGCVAVIAVAAFALQHSGSGGGGLRVANAGATSEQSAGFRLQLWKGAIDLVKENPMGHGMNTYQFYSAKPGTNTITLLAHSTWLELPAEAGILALAALVVLLLTWLFHTFRGARALPTDQNILRASVIAAAFAAAVDGCIESNLYFFGIGLAFFLLLGVGIQLSADAGAPEFVAPPMRFFAVALSILTVGELVFAGYVAKLQANARWSMTNNGIEDARDTLATLRSIAPFDGETWYRSGFLASSRSEALHDFAQAAAVAPSPKYFRRLASLQIEAGENTEALASLHEALDYDPKNLAALRLLLDLQDKTGATDDAKETAKTMIAVEETPYLKIRSLPQVIPTETYEARIYLAKTSPDKTRLLKEAVEGFLEFTRVTLPYARAMAGGGGISVQEAEQETQLGLDTAKQLEAIYRTASDSAGVEWAGKAEAEFSAALGGSK